MTSSPQGSRPPIPEPIKRQVRQRCGFGCAVCGIPIYQYDHMHGFQGQHDPADITLLCARHHSEKTVGLLSLGQVLAASNDPVNLRTGVSAPYPLHYQGSNCLIQFGGALLPHRFPGGVFGELPAIVIDDLPLLGFLHDEGHLMVSMMMFDEYNEQLLVIDRNELVYRVDTWDIEFVGRRLTVRQAARKIFAEIVFTPPGQIEISRARFLYNGVEVLVSPQALVINGMTIQNPGMLAVGGAVLLGVGRNNRGYNAHIFIDRVPRYPETEKEDDTTGNEKKNEK